MKITVNGRLIEVPENSTVDDVKRAAALSSSESLVEVSGAKAVMKSSKDKADPKAKYRSIPPVVQGLDDIENDWALAITGRGKSVSKE